jgi:penicillin-binding protein-related factor A (putative recombinase)
VKVLDLRRALKSKRTPEGEVKSAICEYLQLIKLQTKILDFWVAPNAAIFDPTKKSFRRKGKWERNGLADISGIIKGGRRLEIEVKRPRPRTPAIKQCSEEQVRFLSHINAMGGLAFAASSVAEVKQYLDQHVFNAVDPKESILI